MWKICSANSSECSILLYPIFYPPELLGHLANVGRRVQFGSLFSLSISLSHVLLEWVLVAKWVRCLLKSATGLGDTLQVPENTVSKHRNTNTHTHTQITLACKKSALPCNACTWIHMHTVRASPHSQSPSLDCNSGVQEIMIVENAVLLLPLKQWLPWALANKHWKVDPIPLPASNHLSLALFYTDIL